MRGMVQKFVGAGIVCAVFAAIMPTAATVAAAEARSISKQEREMLITVIAGSCSAEPLSSQVATAGRLLDYGGGVDTIAAAIEHSIERGELSPLALLPPDERDERAYRVAADAVDAALAGARG